MGVVVHGRGPLLSLRLALDRVRLSELSDTELQELEELAEDLVVLIHEEWTRRDDGSTSPTGSDEIPPA